MTFEVQPPGMGGTVLKILVVMAIIVVTWWAVGGGMDAIDVPTTVTTAPATTSTSG